MVADDLATAKQRLAVRLASCPFVSLRPLFSASGFPPAQSQSRGFPPLCSPPQAINAAAQAGADLAAAGKGAAAALEATAAAAQRAPPPLPQVGIIMGSDSDLPVMAEAAAVLEDFGVACEVTVVSAHRTPDRMLEYARGAADRGVKVIIAGAGGAAHLPGMVASLTPLPVIGAGWTHIEWLRVLIERR